MEMPVSKPKFEPEDLLDWVMVGLLVLLTAGPQLIWFIACLAAVIRGDIS